MNVHIFSKGQNNLHALWVTVHTTEAAIRSLLESTVVKKKQKKNMVKSWKVFSYRTLHLNSYIAKEGVILSKYRARMTISVIITASWSWSKLFSMITSKKYGFPHLDSLFPISPVFCYWSLSTLGLRNKPYSCHAPVWWKMIIRANVWYFGGKIMSWQHDASSFVAHY